jgi:tetraacyldisaccharide 4'-kinase
MRFIQFVLYPVAVCYGLIMLVRNLLFDAGILRSARFETPVISVGNLSMGGTGKTPHTEYLIRLLKDRFFVAALSRGYGRESNGFILASKRSGGKYIGDEPLLYVKKFDQIKVAVDEKRERGIRTLLEKFPELNVILLDDAFQHRHVKPGLSILLTDYHHLYCEDHVFPSGRLREFPFGANRADIIIVTKTPRIFSPITRRRIIDDLKIKSRQEIYFSYFHYCDPVPLNDNSLSVLPQKLSYVLLFTGIADDSALREYLERICTDLTTLHFRDHYQYTLKDLEVIKKRFDDLPSQKKIILTTEKDIMRLKTPELSTFLKNLPLFYLPIEVEFHGSDKQTFNNKIISYVETNQRNR